jgi:hypothetical protein
MIEIPTNLLSIRDRIIDCVHQGTPIPDEVNELTKWIETERWDNLVAGWDQEHMVLSLGHLSWLVWSDEEMLAREELTPPLTDKHRLSYARGLVAGTFEGMAGWDVPSVHLVKIEKDNGQSAVLGWLVEIHGQGGAFPVYMGAFLDREHFYQNLRDCDYLFDDEQNSLTDETILRLWTNRSLPNRPIVVTVDWGNESHDCPMSEQTWRRICKGKSVRRIVFYLYEGRRCRSEWLFNSDKFGSLVVNYDDGGVGFDGFLDDARITDYDQTSSWVSELMKYGSSDSLLDALVQRSTARDKSSPPFDYWVVEDSFVMEPSIGGLMLGEAPKFKLAGKKTFRITQIELDALMNKVFEETGAYPDT